MQLFNNMPINRKLSLMILATCMAVLLLVGLAVIVTEVVTSRRAMVDQMTVLADLLGRNSTAALSFHRDEDVEEVNTMLSALAADPYIIMATLYDEKGEAFGSYVRAGAKRSIADRPVADGHHFSGDYLEISRPVEMEQKRIGTIYLRAGLGRMYRQLAIHAAIVGLILLATIVITFAISPSLRRPIAEPILALADLARRVAKHNDYSVRAVKRSEDEIGLLTDAFNQMLGQIEQAQTSLQQANNDLAIAKEAAEAANRAKDQFLAVLSHELRTPLTPVLLTVSLLQSRPQLPQDVQDDIQTIRRHVELEARLIDDLLDLTRIARGKLQLNFEKTDVHVLLKDALKICLSDRMQDVTLDLAANRHFVSADPGRMLQVFWNLLNNARKFTPPGSPIIVRTRDVGHERIRIEVIDRGVGMDADVLPRIFNAFEQAESSSSRSFGGLGLGLTIAKALVDAHRGTIHADSAGKGKGSSFTVELPTVAAVEIANKSFAPESSPATSLTTLRILLVEDHEGTLRLMTKLLSGLGHDVKCADSVQSALAIAQREKIDLVISDLGLPDGNGNELMRQLRDQYGLKGICLSGFGMEEDITRSTDAGFCEHLTKPVDLGKLENAIYNVTKS